MRSVAVPSLALLALALASGPSRAQIFYPPYDVAFDDSFTLLQDDAACKELKVGDDQIPKIDAALLPVRKHYEEETIRLHDVPTREAMRQYPEVRKKTEEAGWKALDGVLRPEQMKRFKQIVFQRRGPAVFADPEVQKRLGMTDEQKALATKFEAERRKKSGQDGAGADELEKLEAEQIRKTVDILTDKQKTVWDDLTGEPFKEKPGWLIHIRKVKVQ